MSRPRKPQPPSSIAPVSQEALNTAIENALHQHQQWMQRELNQLRQEITQLRQETQQLSSSLQPLPDRLTSLLSHWLKQLQTTMQNSASSSARESLQQQLQQLIKALNTWSSQLRQEVSLQQQLLDSMRQLEAKLDDWNGD